MRIWISDVAANALSISTTARERGLVEVGNGKRGTGRHYCFEGDRASLVGMIRDLKALGCAGAAGSIRLQMEGKS